MDLGSGAPDWLNQVILTAINNRASDIHFEPTKTSLNVRIRVDGLLRQLNVGDTATKDSIVSRIKVLAQLNIAEHRTPQDGHYEIEHYGRHYNFRVSTLPTIFGEAIVFRILNRDDEFTTIDKLGLFDDQLLLLRRLISGASGMILTTGPTGSGKTSLLYSIIKSLSKPETSVVTLEDPVEYEMSDIRQTQINESLGLSFALTMRAVLRQDPNYIMLGEIRDAQTAQIAVQATLSGISVVSTFHTFDVPFLINRFSEMGISNSIIAQAIRGVIATRLIRKICDACKEPYEPSENEKLAWGNRPMTKQFMHGKGCPKCLNTGFLGRTGIFEITPFDTEIQSGIIEQKPPSYFYTLIKEKNILSLREAGYKKVEEGTTTISEVSRVLGFI